MNDSKDLKSLVAQRDSVLLKLHELQVNVEGVENEENAKRLNKLTLKKSQFEAQKSAAEVSLAETKSKLLEIQNETAKLTASSMEKILNAIEKQRWYFFKNKINIIFDKTSGLLWANLKYFSVDNNGNGISRDEAQKRVDSFKGDGFKRWRFPSNDEMKHLVLNKTFPFCEGRNYHILNRWVFHKQEGERIDLDNFSTYISYNNSGCIIPCSPVLLTSHANYVTDISNSQNFTREERLAFTLALFTQNDLLPIFDDPEVTELFRQIYFTKPELTKELNEINTQIENLQKVTLLSSEFDYTLLLSRFDTKAADTSLIGYYTAVQQWCDELAKRLDYYEEVKATTLSEFSVIGLSLAKKQKESPHLTPEENALLKARQEFFRKRFSLGLNSVKEKILAVKAQADTLESRIDEIDEGVDSLKELAELEKEPRAKFEFVAENTAKIVKNALKKIEFFEANRDFVQRAIGFWESWARDFVVFKTTRKEALKHDCEDDGIDEEEWTKWFSEWVNLRFAIEQKLWPVVEKGLLSGGVWSGVTSEAGEAGGGGASGVAVRLVEALEAYKKSVDLFYKEERKGIHQKFAFGQGAELQEKFETESALYKRVVAFQTNLQKVVFECEKSEDRIWILKWADSLLDISVDEVLGFVANVEQSNVSSVVLSEFAALKQKNFEIWLADAEAYGKEQARREKEYNSLIFKMKKELTKAGK